MLANSGARHMFCTCFLAWYTRIIIQNLQGELIAREPESEEGIRGVAVVSSFVYFIHFNEETSWSGSGERWKRCSFPVEYFSIFPLLHFAAIRRCYEMKFTLGTLWHHVSKVICHSCRWIQSEWVWGVCVGVSSVCRWDRTWTGNCFHCLPCLPAWLAWTGEL